MEYKIIDICNSLGIGKSTLYKRIEVLKKDIPEEDWKKNSYFYYTDKNKLFFTEKGFAFIRDFKTKKDNIRQNNADYISIYQEQIINIYKERITYLENENKRLLDIISVKEQKELAKDIKYLDSSSERTSKFKTFFNNIFNR